MNEWQYAVESVPFQVSNLADIEVHLSFYGNAGWEIISLVVFPSSNATRSHHALVFMKRRVSLR